MAMSKRAPSWVLAVFCWNLSSLRSCRWGSTSTSWHTSDNNSTVISLTSLWHIEGNPPFGQDRAWSTEKLVPHAQWEGVREGIQCGTGRYIELHVWSSRQHEQERQRLYACAFIHRRIHPQLVHVPRSRSFREHYFINYLFIYYVILTAFRIILSTWLYNYFFWSHFVVLQLIFFTISLDPPLVSPPSYQLLPPPLTSTSVQYPPS